MIRLVLLLLLVGCSYSEVVDAPQTRGIDTLTYTKTDTTSVVDTARIPIQFDVSVERWEE